MFIIDDKVVPVDQPPAHITTTSFDESIFDSKDHRTEDSEEDSNRQLNKEDDAVVTRETIKKDFHLDELQ